MNKDYNAADKKAVEDKAEKDRLERLQEKEDIKFILNSPQGQRFFKRLLKSVDLMSISMTGNSWTYFKEGQRNAVKPFYTDAAIVEPNITAKMLTEILLENNSEEENNG